MPSDISLLNTTIKSLNARYEDLRAMSLTDRPDSDVSDILDQMILVNHDITQFEDLRNHLAAGLITVAPPSDDDVQQIRAALDTLGQAIAADQRWAAAVKTIRSILTAADEIDQNIRKRQGAA